jgi:hypothetical protein
MIVHLTTATISSPQVACGRPSTTASAAWQMPTATAQLFKINIGSSGMQSMMGSPYRCVFQYRGLDIKRRNLVTAALDDIGRQAT